MQFGMAQQPSDWFHRCRADRELYQKIGREKTISVCKEDQWCLEVVDYTENILNSVRYIIRLNTPI